MRAGLAFGDSKEMAFGREAKVGGLALSVHMY